MQELYFITGNKGKFEDAKATIPKLEQLDIDLPEIQAVDPHVIVKAKLLEALQHKKGEFVVEDTSLYLECLPGLPGPLIKWFIKTIGSQGVFELAQKYGNMKAKAKTIVGYAKSREELYFFEGEINGILVSPQHKSVYGFGWDPMFQPDGETQTFAQMPPERKRAISMRALAFTKFKEFLESQ